MPKKILLTGAFGNIGCFVLDALIAQGYEIIAMDKASDSSKKISNQYHHPTVRIVWADIRDRDTITDAVSQVDAVIHLAALIPPLTDDNPELTQAVNVGATQQLIDAMEKSPTAKRLIFASSTGIFGRIQARNRPLAAGDEPCPEDHYGRSKAECELALKSSNLDWTILRIAACPAVNIDSLGSTRDIAIFHNHPDGRVELLHPADAGLAFANAAACDEAIGEVLYLGGGERNRMTALEMFNLLFGTLGFDALPREAFKISDPMECFGEWVDTEQSQRLLNFQHHGPDSIFRDLRNSMGIAKHFSLLIRAARPLATWYLLQASPYYREQKRGGGRRVG